MAYKSMLTADSKVAGKLETTLLARGIRMTRQRRVILEIIEGETQHRNAAQILRKATKVDARINRVTVYRTLSLLKRHALLDPLDLSHGEGDACKCERQTDSDHLHITCLRCAKIHDLESELFDRLKGQIERDCHFHITVARFELGGYCSACRRAHGTIPS